MRRIALPLPHWRSYSILTYSTMTSRMSMAQCESLRYEPH